MIRRIPIKIYIHPNEDCVNSNRYRIQLKQLDVIQNSRVSVDDNIRHEQ